MATAGGGGGVYMQLFLALLLAQLISTQCVRNPSMYAPPSLPTDSDKRSMLSPPPTAYDKRSMLSPPPTAYDKRSMFSPPLPTVSDKWSPFSTTEVLMGRPPSPPPRSCRPDCRN